MPDRPPKTEKVNIELFLYRLDEIKVQQEETNRILANLNTVYVPRPEITEKFKVVHDRIDEIETNHVSKTAHSALHERVKSIEGVFSVITKVVITAIVISLLALLGLKS